MENWSIHEKVEKELEPVIAQTFKHFLDVKDSKLVVANSIPILFFGNLKAYLNSPLKIVTVALNPSDKEFSEWRFDVSGEIYNDTRKYLETLSAYFTLNPYSRWFNNYEKLLQHLSASYFPKNNRPVFYDNLEKPISNSVLHTDICSPIATSKTWSKFLSNSEREFRANLQHEGELIWSELLSVLKPDLILVSGSKKMREYFGVTWNEIKLPDDFDKSHKMCSAQYNGSKIFWFSAKNTPISFKDDQLELLAWHVLGSKKHS